VTRAQRNREAPALAGPPVRASAATFAARAALVALAGAVLFFCYWRQSQSVPLSSDGSGNVLQAWDMLHGNLLLQNWWVSDVSFYTTELPQYMLIEALGGGLGTWVVHAAAAMTYTLLVILAALLAKGRVPGRAGLARALLAAGLMLAPQLSATGIVLLSPDHTGTAVPLLVAWLLIDRARPRWYVPVLAGLLFAWTMVADSIVLLTGIIPLVLVCALRACLTRGRARPIPRWYELALAGAAAVAGVAGSFAPRAMAALGGYQQSPVPLGTSFGQLPHGAWVTLQAFLELFGANLFGASFNGTTPVLEVVLVALHLAGAIAVAWAIGLGIARILRSGELMVPVFAVAILLNLGAYLVSPQAESLLGAREVAAVLPLGAVLAGRILGDRLLAGMRAARAWFRPALAVVAAGYLAALAYGAAQAPVPPAHQPLADWLVAHGLTDGLASYWHANSTTLDSGRRVQVSGVAQDVRDRLVPYLWETGLSNYDPARHYANFVVADGPSAPRGLQLAAERTFGPPARVYLADGYTVMVWDTNLLAQLDSPGLR
jgi:hypothetical protein